MTEQTFPRVEPLRSAREVDEYLSGERLVCLICGKRYRAVGHHVSHKHGISAEDYKDRYRIPRSRGLVGSGTREKFSASVRRTIEAGGLADQHAWIARQAREANARSVDALKQIQRDTGRTLGLPPAITADDLRRIIAEVAGGSTLKAAIGRSGWSWTGVHHAFSRHPDLQVEYVIAKRHARAERARAKRRRKLAKRQS